MFTAHKVTEFNTYIQVTMDHLVPFLLISSHVFMFFSLVSRQL